VSRAEGPRCLLGGGGGPLRGADGVAQRSGLDRKKSPRFMGALELLKVAIQLDDVRYHK
jgi:hypothetical protein